MRKPVRLLDAGLGILDTTWDMVETPVKEEEESEETMVGL